MDGWNYLILTSLWSQGIYGICRLFRLTNHMIYIMMTYGGIYQWQFMSETLHVYHMTVFFFVNLQTFCRITIHFQSLLQMYIQYTMIQYNDTFKKADNQRSNLKHRNLSAEIFIYFLYPHIKLSHSSSYTRASTPRRWEHWTASHFINMWGNRHRNINHFQ